MTKTKYTLIFLAGVLVGSKGCSALENLVLKEVFKDESGEVEPKPLHDAGDRKGDRPVPGGDQKDVYDGDITYVKDWLRHFEDIYK